MKREDAEKLADDIFDMIDRNHPRGLIKSELVDLLCKFEPAVQETYPFPRCYFENASQVVFAPVEARSGPAKDVAIYGTGIYICGND